MAGDGAQPEGHHLLRRVPSRSSCGRPRRHGAAMDLGGHVRRARDGQRGLVRGVCRRRATHAVDAALAARLQPGRGLAVDRGRGVGAARHGAPTPDDPHPAPGLAAARRARAFASERCGARRAASPRGTTPAETGTTCGFPNLAPSPATVGLVVARGDRARTRGVFRRYRAEMSAPGTRAHARRPRSAVARRTSRSAATARTSRAATALHCGELLAERGAKLRGISHAAGCTMTGACREPHPRPRPHRMSAQSAVGGLPMAKLNINGKERDVSVEPDTPLLWVIRENVGLTGTKYGCGVAQCGACSVHLNGNVVRSCSMPVGAIKATDRIVTIEGLSPNARTPCSRRGLPSTSRSAAIASRVRSWRRRRCWRRIRPERRRDRRGDDQHLPLRHVPARPRGHPQAAAWPGPRSAPRERSDAMNKPPHARQSIPPRFRRGVGRRRRRTCNRPRLAARGGGRGRQARRRRRSRSTHGS